VAKTAPGATARLEALLGHSFSDRTLVEQALTHGSGTPRRSDYQRLEFLGDRVLGLVIAEELYRKHGADSEGQMSSRHSSLVRAETCAEIGLALGVDGFVIVGANERRKGLQKTVSVLGDVVEALIGALYLDGGLAVARRFILQHWKPVLARHAEIRKDAKTTLQEWALGRQLAIPHYEVLTREGPEHAPQFTVRLTVAGLEPVTGNGTSKRAAEMTAAEFLLNREGIR
jgi:ribonuclease-3